VWLLGISGIYSTNSSYYKKGTKENKGVQIDLLIDRNDHVINVCEMKFYNADFVLTKAYEKQLRTKMRDFQLATKTRKYISLILATTFGLEQNAYSQGLIEQTIILKDLFEKV